MNYSKNNIKRKLRNFNSEKIEQKAGMTLVRIFLLIILASVIGGSCVTFGLIGGLLESAPDISLLSTAPAESATYICDSEGNPVQKLTAPSSNRIPVSISDIPLDLQHAVVAIEDQRFYEHNGIDVRGIIRAFVVGVTGGSFSEGASTITQQLLKNNVFTGWTSESTIVESFKRKFQEQFLAIQLENNLEKDLSKAEAKDKILEDYLNTINLGAGTYGVEAAAQRYFNKSVSDLTLSECAVIAGITQNPSGYDPITNPSENAGRRKSVLNKMLAQGYISTAQFDEALSDDVYDRIQENASITDDSNSVYSYYTDAMIEQVLEDLVDVAGYTQTQASQALYSGGLRIYSVQDSRIQKICDEEFANQDNYPETTLIGLDYALSVNMADGATINYSSNDFESFFRSQDSSFNMMFPDKETAQSYIDAFKETVVSKNDTILGERIDLVPQPQASVVVIEQSTGYVKAIVGGRGQKEASLTLNRATSTRRQPGSTFKPLAVYAPALQSGNFTLASTFENAPYQYSSGTEFSNWDSDYGYDGWETLHTALMKSVNVVAVKLITKLTPQTSLDYLEELGITTLYNGEKNSNGEIITDAYEPLALGGVTDGVVNLELTAAYAALANQGSYIKPKFYSKILDRNGNVILENTCEEKEVFSEQTAYLMTSAMESVIHDPEGTAYEYIGLGDMAVAGKTGTTDHAKDIWFEGYTPYYTCGIWGGYDNNQAFPSDDKSYTSYAKVLWNSIMNRIHEDLEVKDFPMPEGIVTATICKKSGKLAVEGRCDADPRGSQITTEYFRKGTAPTEECDMHVAVKLCNETGLVASKTCTSTTTSVYLKLPKGSSTETDDALYEYPTTTCAGHATKKKETEKKETEKSSADKTDTQSGQSSQNTQTGQSTPSAGTIVDGQTYDSVTIVDGQTYDQSTYNFDSIPADSYYDDGITIY